MFPKETYVVLATFLLQHKKIHFGVNLHFETNPSPHDPLLFYS